MGSEPPRGKVAQCGEAVGGEKGAEAVGVYFMPGSFTNIPLCTVGIMTPNLQLRELSLQQVSEPLKFVPLVDEPAGRLLGSDEGRRATLGKPCCPREELPAR